jgi:hypothetical protein
MKTIFAILCVLVLGCKQTPPPLPPMPPGYAASKAMAVRMEIATPPVAASKAMAMRMEIGGGAVGKTVTFPLDYPDNHHVAGWLRSDSVTGPWELGGWTTNRSITLPNRRAQEFFWIVYIPDGTWLRVGFDKPQPPDYFPAWNGQPSKWVVNSNRYAGVGGAEWIAP